MSAVLTDPHSASLLGPETEEAVRVRRPSFRYYPGPIVCAVAAIPFAAITALGYLTERHEWSPDFYRGAAIGTVVLIALAVFTTLLWMAMGITVSPRQLGVVIVTGRKQFSYRYADIDAFTVSDSPRYDNYRRVVALNRAITIEAEGEKKRFHYVAMPNDLLDDMLDRLTARIAAETRPRSGAKWELGTSTLRYRGEDVPLNQIAKAGIFDNEIRAWKRGEPMPFLAVPYSSRNARLLLYAFHNAPPAEPVAASVIPSTTSVDGIGRELFVRRTSITSVIFTRFLAACVLWVGWIAVDKKLPEFNQLGHGALIGIAVLAALHALNRIAMRYRFHERGLTRTTLLGNRTLMYAQIASMTWSETVTMIQHSIPLGTTKKIRFVPIHGKPLNLKMHRWTTTDTDLDSVRRVIADHIAANLHHQLEQEGRVPWTKDATFTREGLELKTGLLGNKLEFVPYDQQISVLMHEGFLNLYRETWRKPLVLLRCNGENFYPGFSLLFLLMHDVQVPQAQIA